MPDLWFFVWRTFAVIEALLCVVALILGTFGVADAWNVAGRSFGEACVSALLGWPELQPRPTGSRSTLSVQGDG